MGKCGRKESRCQDPDIPTWTLDHGPWTLDPGRWTQDAGQDSEGAGSKYGA